MFAFVVFVSDTAIFVLKGDVKLQLTNCLAFVVLDLVFQYLVNILARKNISEHVRWA